MYQLLSGRNAISDRFYRALYAVLLTEGARGAAGVRGPQFLSLLVKAMKGDASLKRVSAFAKRLMQVCGWVLLWVWVGVCLAVVCVCVGGVRAWGLVRSEVAE